jgi:S1-C subfamily serine protease
MAATSAAVSERVRSEPGPAGAIPQVVVVQTPGAAAPANAAPIPLEDLVARVAPAVVLVQASGGRGSGFFVESDTIITNAHVVGSDSLVRIKRVDGETVDARVDRVATDLDLAVLKTSSSSADQATLTLGSNASVRSGQDVVAIGSPLGTLQTSVTRGIVSAVRTNGR